MKPATDGLAPGATTDLPRFVWGRAYAGLDQLDERTFLTYTHAPRFVCSLLTVDAEELPAELREAGSDEMAIVELLGDNAEGANLWLTSSGLIFQSFAFADPAPDDPDLSQVLLLAAADFERFSGSIDPTEEPAPGAPERRQDKPTRH